MTTRFRHNDALITTGMRINAEPAPAAPDLGVRHTGTSGPAPKYKPADTESMWAGIEKGLGMLSPADVAKIKAHMRKFCMAEGTVTPAGIATSSTDRAHAESDRIAAINEAGRAFWDRQYAETERRLFGR